MLAGPLGLRVPLAVRAFEAAAAAAAAALALPALPAQLLAQ